MLNKINIHIIIGVCIFLAIPLYYFIQNKQWEKIRLDTHNFYLSVQLPKGCKITWYDTRTRSGRPMLGSSFIADESFDIEILKKQLDEQKLRFVGETIYSNQEKNIKYEKLDYFYGLNHFEKNKWGESVTRSD